MKEIIFEQRIPVRYNVNVLVAGGGPSGIAAAVTASRYGADVLLVDAHTCLGGMGTAGRVPIFCKFSDGIHFLAGGIGREVYEKCFREGAVGPDDEADSDKKLNSISIKSEVLKRIYDDMVVESKAKILFLTRVIGVVQEAGRLSYIVCSSKSGIFAVKADVYIDCTGDCDIAAMAGVPLEKGDENHLMQPPTLCSSWCGIDWEAVKKNGYHDLWPQNSKELERAIEDGIFSQEDWHLSGMWITGKSTGGGNIGHIFGVDGTDEVSYTNAMIKGRKLMLEYEKYYKQYLKGFEEIDIHPMKPGKDSYEEYKENFEQLRYGMGESYGIPYRALLPRNISNLLVAGRCISTDRYVQSSIRMMPGCFITGQAAGMAAGMAGSNNGNVKEINIRELQKKLKAMGAYLPNCN